MIASTDGPIPAAAPMPASLHSKAFGSEAVTVGSAAGAERWLTAGFDERDCRRQDSMVDEEHC